MLVEGRVWAAIADTTLGDSAGSAGSRGEFPKSHLGYPLLYWLYTWNLLHLSRGIGNCIEVQPLPSLIIGMVIEFQPLSSIIIHNCEEAAYAPGRRKGPQRTAKGNPAPKGSSRERKVGPKEAKGAPRPKENRKTNVETNFRSTTPTDVMLISLFIILESLKQ